MLDPVVQSFFRKPSNASGIYLYKHVHVREIQKVRNVRVLAHVNVLGSNAPNELVPARNSFVRGIPLSVSLSLKMFV